MAELVRTLAAQAGAPKPFAVPRWIPRLIAPYLAQVTSMHMNLSNAMARRDLGWQPAYPTIEEGLAQTLPAAA